MRYLRNLFVALLAVSSAAFAQERGTADEAKALVTKALTEVKAIGAEKAFAEFSNKDSGKWINKDLYIVVLKHDGTILSHGVNKALIGKNLIDVKDPNGKLFSREIIETGKKGTGWVDYQFTDPATKKIGNKSSFVSGVPGTDAVLAVGIYK